MSATSDAGLTHATSTVALSSAVVAVTSLALPWFGQYDKTETRPAALGFEWSGWSLLAQSSYDHHSATSTVLALLVLVLTLGLLAVTWAAHGAAAHRPLIPVSALLAFVTVVVSFVVEAQAKGVFGDGHLVAPLPGLTVWRVAVALAFVALATAALRPSREGR